MLSKGVPERLTSMNFGDLKKVLMMFSTSSVIVAENNTLCFRSGNRSKTVINWSRKPRFKTSSTSSNTNF